MTITPERQAEISALVDAVIDESRGSRTPKPKVITRSDRGTIREADVRVLRADVNAKGDAAETVPVRRPDGWGEVTVDPAYEREWHQREADRAQARYDRQRLDPCGLGIWGRFDDE